MAKISQWATKMSSEAAAGGSSVQLVDRGTFLSKPSLHMVGCTGKNGSSFSTNPDGGCPLCKAKGQFQALRTFRINFTQSMYLCSNPQCIYPLGHTPLDNIIVNTADLKNLSPSKQKKRSISELSPPSMPDGKRSKLDPSMCGPYNLTNASPSNLEDGNKDVPDISIPECDKTFSKTSRDGPSECSDFLKQTELFGGLQIKPPCSAAPSGSSSPAGQNGLHKEVPQNEVQMVNQLSHGSDYGKEKVNGINYLKESRGKDHEELGSYSARESPVFKNINGVLENVEVPRDKRPSSKLTLPATTLQQTSLNSSINLDSSKDTDNSSQTEECALTVSRTTAESCNLLENILQNLSESLSQQNAAAGGDTAGSSLKEKCAFAVSPTMTEIKPEKSCNTTENSLESLGESLESKHDRVTLHNSEAAVNLGFVGFSPKKMPTSPKSSELVPAGSRTMTEMQPTQSCNLIENGRQSLGENLVAKHDSVTLHNVEAPVNMGCVGFSLKKTPICLKSPECALTTITAMTERKPAEPLHVIENGLKCFGESMASECAASNLYPAPHSSDVTEDSRSVTGKSPSSVLKSEPNVNNILLTSVSPCQESSVSALNPEDPPIYEMRAISCLIKADPPPCQSDNDSYMDVSQSPCSTLTDMTDCSVEEPSVLPSKVCDLSPTVQLKDTKKINFDSRSFKEQDIFVFKAESSASVPSRSYTAEAAVNMGHDRPKRSPKHNEHLSDMQRSSETTTLSASTQDTLPQSPSLSKLSTQDTSPQSPSLSKLSGDVSLIRGSMSLAKNGPSMDTAATLERDAALPVHLVNGYHKSVGEQMMSSKLLSDKSVDDKSMMAICSFLSNKDSSNTESNTEAFENKNCIQYRGSSSPSPSTHDVAGSPCVNTSIVDNVHNTPSSVSHSHMGNCESTSPQISHAKGIIEQEGMTLNKDRLGRKDIKSAKETSTLMSDYDLESKEAVKKAYFENTVLPDLLLDIQPEHRIEDSMSTASSPMCKEDLTATRDKAHLDTLNIFQEGLLKQHVQGEEKAKMEITDPELSNDDIQSSLNLSGSLPSEDSLNNESLESGSLCTTMEQQLSNNNIEPRTFDNSQRRLQWRNKLSLCWLDCILSTLVQSKTISIFVEKHGGDTESIICNLFAKYNEAMAMSNKLSSKRGRAGKPAKSEVCLHEVRMHIFDKLKPLLKCELGQKESPVFAFPLLLKLDPYFQNLFMHSFTWNFKCESCGYTYQERCQKTLTTFTKIIKDWSPLNAVHKAPCNNCQVENQTRQMNLEALDSMFMLHFVEGLPSNDLKEYAFQFDGHWYEIKTVIKYREDHFSTWTENDDDSWLESDGLKGSICWRHHKFKVRAENIHFAIWERSNSKRVRLENSSTDKVHVSEGKPEDQPTMATAEMSHTEAAVELPLLAPGMTISTSSLVEPPAQATPALVNGHLDSATEHPSPIIPASETSPALPPVAAPVSSSLVLDTSDPLAGMENYADDDVITLTLVEIPFDSNNCPAENNPDLAKLPNAVDTQMNVDSSVVLQGGTRELQQSHENNHSEVMQLLADQTSLDTASVIGSQQQLENTDPRQEVLVKSTRSRSSHKQQPVASSDPIQPLQKTGSGQGVHSQPLSDRSGGSFTSNFSKKVQRSTTSQGPITAGSKARPAADQHLQKSPCKPAGGTKYSNGLPAAVATSTPIHQPFSTKRSLVGHLMSNLVKKDNSFLNGSLSSANKKNVPSKQWQPFHLLKETDVNGVAKKAGNFDGFRARTPSKNSTASDLLLSKLANNFTHNNAPKEKPIQPTQMPKCSKDSSVFTAPKERTFPSVKSFLTSTASRTGRNGSFFGKIDGSAKNGDHVQKLRVKLLKKLKAKKNELAMLEKMAKLKQNGSDTGDVPAVDRKEHLRGFLQELQDQIDNADNESVCTRSSCTSVCSSPGDAEFFAELFSPSAADNPENDSRFLEMLADGFQISNCSQQTNGFDHHLSSSTTPVVNSFPSNLSQSTSEDESFDIMTSSTLAALNEDTGYLASFDDLF